MQNRMYVCLLGTWLMIDGAGDSQCEESYGRFSGDLFSWIFLLSLVIDVCPLMGIGIAYVQEISSSVNTQFLRRWRQETGLGTLNMGSQHIFIEQLLVNVFPLRTNNSWFSPLHVLIIDYLAPISVFATLCLLVLNTAQVNPTASPH